MRTSLAISMTVLVLMGGGYLLLDPDVRDEPGGRATLEGVVTDVNLDGVMVDGPAVIDVRTPTDEVRRIALPSMGLPMCPARPEMADAFVLEVGDRVRASGSVLEDGTLVPCDDPADYLHAETIHADPASGYAFPYRKAPRGYVAVTDVGDSHADFVSGVVLYDRAAYEDAAGARDAREGPPFLAVHTYQNPARLSAFVWPGENPAASHTERILGEVLETVVGGANAARYRADGLYPMEVVVVANGALVHVLTGTFPPEDGRMAADFRDLVDGFAFRPAPGASAVPVDESNERRP